MQGRTSVIERFQCYYIVWSNIIASVHIERMKQKLYVSKQPNPNIHGDGQHKMGFSISMAQISDVNKQWPLEKIERHVSEINILLSNGYVSRLLFDRNGVKLKKKYQSIDVYFPFFSTMQCRNISNTSSVVGVLCKLF